MIKTLYSIVAFSLCMTLLGCSTMHEEWARIDAQQDAELYRLYLRKHPYGQYSELCRQRLAESEALAAWTYAAWLDDTLAYQEFLEEHPESYFVPACLLRLNELNSALEWQYVSSTDSLELYLQFLFKYQFSSAGDSALVALSFLIDDYCDWQQALSANSIESYARFLKMNPNSHFRESAESRIIDLEVEDILKKKPPKLPAAERVEYVPNRGYSVVNVFNNTEYELTVRYSGKQSFKVTFLPYERGSIELANGKYTVVASANAKDVRDYAGEENCDGSNYQMEYYIVSDGSKYVPAEESLQYFEQWNTKRRFKPEKRP